MKIAVPLVLSFTVVFSTSAQSRSDRERDGLVGPVKSVHIEAAFKECVSGEFVDVEGTTAREEYDPSGRVIGNRNRFVVDDPISRMLVYPFDESLPRIEKPTYWENGKLIYTDVYIYDNKSRRAEHVCYKADGTIQYRSEIVFDEHGRIAESKSYNANGSLGSWNVIKRDGQGNVVESSYFKADGTLTTAQKGGCSYLNKFVSTYEFDSAGNWVKQIMAMPVLRDGRTDMEPFAIRHRTITYY